VNGPLQGVKVVELASFWGAWAGRTLADLGADVIVVEPPGGHFTRTFGPFVDDQPHPDRSLWWWYYNASKRSVVIDLSPAGRLGGRRDRR
jgi:crotonobetainyl-CoA:carnitine CoA-transferase CaiB-like acyl-CoA transferase